MAAEEALLKRVMPYNMEAEQSVIGCMLLSREAITVASDSLKEEDFYNRQYGVVFEAIVELYDAGQSVDLVTLQNKLREKDVPPEVSSLEFVKDMMLMVQTTTHIADYVQIVSEKATQRRLIKACEEIANVCYVGKDGLNTILEDAEKKIFHIVQRRNTGDYVPIRQVVLSAMERIEKASRTKGNVTGVATGFLNRADRKSVV